MNFHNRQSSSKIKNLLNLATNRRKKTSPNLTCVVLLSLLLDTAQSLKNMSQCLQKLLEVNKPVGEQPPLQGACPHTNDSSAFLASLVPQPSGFTVSRPLWEHSDNEQSSFLLDMSSPTAYDYKPQNLVQKALDIAPPHSKGSEEQVTATASSSTEQLLEPCTQKTGSLLGHRADNSHL